jgi:hypothetical protein
MRADDDDDDDDESPNSVTSHGWQTSTLFTNETGSLVARGQIGRHVCLVILSIEANRLAAPMRPPAFRMFDNRCYDSKIADFSSEHHRIADAESERESERERERERERESGGRVEGE